MSRESIPPSPVDQSETTKRERMATVGKGAAVLAVFGVLFFGGRELFKSDDGHQPDVISDCSDQELQGEPVTFDGEDWNDPDEVLRVNTRWSGSNYNDTSNRSGFLRGADAIDGLGEIVCIVPGSEGTELVFLPSGESIRDDMIEEHNDALEAYNNDPTHTIEKARENTQQPG